MYPLQFEPFDEMTLMKIRSLISKHYDHTIFSDGVGPPALFKFLGKQLIMYRVGQRLRHDLQLSQGGLEQHQEEMLNQVFPSEGLPVTLNGSDKIVTMQDIADWMTQVAQIIFDFIHWQHPCKEVLLEVRKYIENVYDEDLVPKLPINFLGSPFGAPDKIPKAGVVHRVGVRVRHMLIEKYGELPDEADDLFAEVFPLPDPSGALVAADFADLMAPIIPFVPWIAPSGPTPPTFVKQAVELKAALGESDMDNVQAKLVATLLKNAEEYAKAHPEAPGVGPLDGAGIVQTMAPFQVVNPSIGAVSLNGKVYPKGVWDEAVKKLQPKFSGDIEHPKPAEHIEVNLVVDKNKAVFAQGVPPEMDVKLVVGEDGNSYMEMWLAGKLIEKKPVPTALTQEGLATLNRFGVVLKGA